MVWKNGLTPAEVPHGIPKVRVRRYVVSVLVHCGLWSWQVDMGSAFGSIRSGASARIDRSNIVRLWENDR